MSNYSQLQQQLANDVISIINDQISEEADSLETLLDDLINAMPYYGSPDMQQAHRGTLANLLGVNLPDNGITAPPDEMGVGYTRLYSYNGSYSGYRNAFYNGVTESTAASQVAARAAAINGGLNNGWWGNYGVAVLSDAVRLQLGFSLDT